MISVNVRLDGITIDGHAGYADHGNDIVCAAISALAHNLVTAIDSLTSDVVQCGMSAGHMNINYRDLSTMGSLLVDSFFIGVCQVADAYPDYVSII